MRRFLRNQRIRKRLLLLTVVLLFVLSGVWLRHLASWRPQTYKLYQRDANDLALSPDGRLLASVGLDAKDRTAVKLLDVQSFDIVRSVAILKADDHSTVALTPDLKTLVCAEPYYSVADEEFILDSVGLVLRDTTTGKQLFALQQSYYHLDALVFSSRGDLLGVGATASGPVTGSDFGVWELWQVRGRKLRWPPLLHTSDRVSRVDFAPDGQTVVTGLLEGTLKIWSTKSNKLLRVLDAYQQDKARKENGDFIVMALAVSPDGKLIASSHYDNTLRLWNAQAGKPLRILRGYSKLVQAVAFSPDGGILAGGRQDGAIVLWNTRTGAKLRMLQARHGGVLSIAFAPDGTSLASGYGDGTVALWRIK